MATVTVRFEVKPGGGVTAYAISVGKKPVLLTNGKGSVRLSSGRRHFLLWWFAGTEGSKIAITGTRSGEKVVEVKNSRIPLGEDEGAGAKRFYL